MVKLFNKCLVRYVIFNKIPEGYTRTFSTLKYIRNLCEAQKPIVGEHQAIYSVINDAILSIPTEEIDKLLKKIKMVLSAFSFSRRLRKIRQSSDYS